MASCDRAVVAVDPVSERALLGTAGDFLAPLEKAPARRRPQRRRDRPALREPLHQRHRHGRAQGRPDFLGVKLKYWAPLMTQYQQAKRDGQLTADSQGLHPADRPLRHRPDPKYSVKIEEIDGLGNVTKDVGTVTRSLDKDYLPFVSKSLFALAWLGSKDLRSSWVKPHPSAKGLYTRPGPPTSPRPRPTKTATPPPTAPRTRAPRPANGSP